MKCLSVFENLECFFQVTIFNGDLKSFVVTELLIHDNNLCYKLHDYNEFDNVLPIQTT